MRVSTASHPGAAAGETRPLVVPGSPVGARKEDHQPFLREVLHLLEGRLAAGRPTLGVCLGTQT